MKKWHYEVATGFVPFSPPQDNLLQWIDGNFSTTPEQTISNAGQNTLESDGAVLVSSEGNYLHTGI